MKEIKAIVRPALLEILRRELRAIPNFPGMTVMGCEGLTAPGRLGEQADPLNDFTRKVQITVVASDELAQVIVERIRSSAATGRLGDGLVWVMDVNAMWRLSSAADPTHA